jgi:hypothetical protein
MPSEKFKIERNPDADYELFRQSILEQIGDVSGERFRRASGEFSLASQMGETLKIHFATCTHEQEPSTKSASEAELHFLRSHLLQSHTPADLLLVEQGSAATTKNHIQSIIDEIALSNPSLGQEIRNRENQKQKRRTEISYSSEIKLIPEEFQQADGQSLNIDLTLNPFAYRYIYEEKGLEEVVFYACCELSDYVLDWKNATPELVIEVLKRSIGLDEKTLERAREFARGYLEPLEDLFRLYASDKNLHMNNAYRDLFMARQIQALPSGSYKLLCHTAHLVGILGNLKPVLQHVTLDSTEVATHTLEKQKQFMARKK